MKIFYRIVMPLLLCTVMCTACRTGSDFIIPEDIQPAVHEIPADAVKGFHWPYILYIPEEIRYSSTPVIVISNNSAPSDDYSDHYNNAKRKIMQYRRLADTTGIPLMLCAIPRFESTWWVDTQSLTRNALLTDIENLQRMDLQVVAMLKDARRQLKHLDIESSGKAVLFGFSASGSFACRFAVLHPELVEILISGAPGGWITLPLESWQNTRLRYQVGTADLEDITGKEFNDAAYRRIPKFFFVGTEDTDNAVGYLDSYTYEDRLTITHLFGGDNQERYRNIRSIFQDNNVEADFMFYEGIDHRIPPKAWDDILTFIQDIMEALE